MTAPDPTPEAEAPTPEEPSQPDSLESAVGDDEPIDLAVVKKLRHEAASLRVRLREAEAKLADQSDVEKLNAAMQRREVERVASEILVDADDVWRIDPTLQQDWFDSEFGDIVPDKVREAARALAASKPHLARPDLTHEPPPTAQPLEGLRPGASPELKQAEVTWSSALRRHGV